MKVILNAELQIVIEKELGRLYKEKLKTSSFKCACMSDAIRDLNDNISEITKRWQHDTIISGE